MKNLRNFTPHEINIITESSTVSLPSEGIARCSEIKTHVSDICSVPVYSISYGEVSGLPDPDGESCFIVSAIAAQALAGKRDDVYIVTDTVRNDSGQIIGCRGLAKYQAA